MLNASGVAGNFLQGVRQSVAFLSIQPCSVALPSLPYNQKTNRLYEQLHVTVRWPQ